MSNVYRSNKKSGGITPTGTKQITINAAGTTTHDVAAYANAEITTSGLVVPTGTKTITQNGTGIDVANYEFVDVSVSGGVVPFEFKLTRKSYGNTDGGDAYLYGISASDYSLLSVVSVHGSGSTLTVTGYIDGQGTTITIGTTAGSTADITAYDSLDFKVGHGYGTSSETGFTFRLE